MIQFWRYITILSQLLKSVLYHFCADAQPLAPFSNPDRRDQANEIRRHFQGNNYYLIGVTCQVLNNLHVQRTIIITVLTKFYGICLCDILEKCSKPHSARCRP